MEMKFAEVNGTKPKSLRTWYGEIRIKTSRAGKPARQKESYMKVFSNDFAAVDVREALCYPTPPKKQIRRNFFSIFRFNTLILCIVLIPYLIYNNTSHAFKRNYICTRYRQNFYNIVLYILNRICFFRCKSAFLCNSFMYE